MALEIFGWSIRRKAELEREPVSFAPKETDDGAVIVAPGGGFGTYVDLDGSVRTETELISKYRDMSLFPEVDAAIEEIVNEAVAMDEEEPVSINLDEIDKITNSPKVRDRIIDEFKGILRLMDFTSKGHDIFRQWYIDGRIYYHVIIDENNTLAGIKELRYVDPRKIRKVREVNMKRILPQPGGPGSVNATVQQTQNEYYVYTEKGFNVANRMNPTGAVGLRIAADAVIYIASGLTDVNRTMVLSFLHKAIKPLNQLRTLEDATVIYRLARAPERRVWFIDVGNLPKMKAEQYVRDIMLRHKNRLVYDSVTGDIRDDRKFMTMLEDYWLPRRGEVGKGTEVTTLPAGQNLGEMEDVHYFQKKLYSSLNVPVDRLNKETSIFPGNMTPQITREELKFNKFINRLRNRFSTVFLEVLERQLVLKNLITYEQWLGIKDLIKFNFARDSHFTEIKNNEILMGRLTTLQQIEPYVGRFFSAEWVRRNVLQQSDETMEEIDKEIELEQDDPRWAPSQDQGMPPDAMQGAPPGAPPGYDAPPGEANPQYASPQQQPQPAPSKTKKPKGAVK